MKKPAVSLVDVLALRGHSRYRRLTTQPDAENVQRGIGVAIMRRPAVRTFPTSYAKCAYAFRAADGIAPAARTHLGSVSLVGFGKRRPCLLAFIREHQPETRPAGIGNGFSHPCPLEAGRVHIANNDVTVLPHKFGRLLVQEIFAAVRDLGVYRSNTRLIARSLGFSQGRFVLREVFGVLNRAPVTERGERLDAEVDADSRTSLLGGFFDLALKDDVPAPASVFDKTGAPQFALKWSRLPKTELTPLHNYVVFGYSVCADLQGHPAQRPLAAKDGPESRASTLSFTGLAKAQAEDVDCVGKYSKFLGGAGCQLHQIKGRRPARIRTGMPAPFRLTLNLAEIIPDKITGARLALKVPANAGVFHPVFERNDHANNLGARGQTSKSLLSRGGE